MNTTRFFSQRAAGLLAVALLLACATSSASAVLPVTDGLQLWLDADALTGLNDADPVATWNDESGKGSHATQSDAEHQPAYYSSGLSGKPVVRFDGNDDITTSSSFDTPYTVFTVSQMEGTQSHRLITSGSVNWLLGYYGGNRDRMYAEGWVHQSGPSAGIDPHLYSATGTGSLTSFYHNGIQLASNSEGTSGIGRLRLGAWDATTEKQASKGDVAEVLIYDRVLDTAERRGVGAYLSFKYGFDSEYITFTGGDVGEWLDLDGLFSYAVDVGRDASTPDLQVRDALFTDHTVNGVTITGTVLSAHETKPDYGASADDDNLETIMHSIRHGGPRVDLDVEVGQEYKLQLMFSDNGRDYDRAFSVIIEGETVAEIVAPAFALDRGTVFTYQFRASDDILNIVLSGQDIGAGTDHNPILNAFTLENVPEPGTLMLACAGLVGLLLIVGPRRRKQEWNFGSWNS